jgi:nitrogen fixation-related uncharacterized protein
VIATFLDLVTGGQDDDDLNPAERVFFEEARR